jgi:DNA-binding response OmpR family regulator
MVAESIYMMNGRGPDQAIVKGLTEAGCQVHNTHGVAETLSALRSKVTPGMPPGVMLVAEVQAGAIPLLTLLHENGMSLPPTLLFDQEGNNIQAVIKALQLGVQDYVLASEPAPQRELRARVLAERLSTFAAPRPKSAPLPVLPAAVAPVITAEPIPAPTAAHGVPLDFQWDPEAHMIYVEDKYVRLSPVEGRVFDMLLAKRNRTVPMQDLIRQALMKLDADLDSGIKLLRPHVMRLRNKLQQHPRLAHRIVNVRATGYMFI